MNLADIRTRLAGLEGRAYWRSLEELADTPEFREYVHREFPAQASEFNDPAGRRQFLKLMGASLALAGVSACTRQPEEKIVPYVRQPEEIVPGRPLFFATAMPLGGFGIPLLAENHMGRPTKLEGNPEHPASLGATDIFGQASVLTLYDPDRSRTVVGRGEVQDVERRSSRALQAAVTSRRALKGAGLPAAHRAGDVAVAARTDRDAARRHAAKPSGISGMRSTARVQGGAPAATPLYRFDKRRRRRLARRGFPRLRARRRCATRRISRRGAACGTPRRSLNRLYVVEPVPTVTGANADHRLALKSRDVHAFAAALAAARRRGRCGRRPPLPDADRDAGSPPIAADLSRTAAVPWSSPATRSRPRCTRSRAR